MTNQRKPGVMLARDYSDDLDPRGWWLSEKLDGVRGLWTGRQLLTRTGNRIAAPDWWLRGLPAAPLESLMSGSWCVQVKFSGGDFLVGKSIECALEGEEGLRERLGGSSLQIAELG